MKIILNILLVILIMCLSVNSSIYDWHVQTMERDSDFGDDLKVQTALNKERQQDLLNLSGKISNTNYYPNYYYKNIGLSANKLDDTNKFDDIMKPFKILQQNDKLHEDNIFKAKNNDKDFIIDNLNYKNNNKNLKINNEHYKYVNNKQSFNSIDIVDNNSYHDNLKYIQDLKWHDPIKHQDKNNDTTLQLEIETKNIEDVDKVVNKTLKESYKDPIINHCSGKYTDIENFVGTNLFDNTAKSCFTNEEVALLTIRKDFEVSLKIISYVLNI